MANTVDLNEITEYHDTAADLQRKLDQTAELLRASHHAVLFTGAGISTSAQIPDFRGPNGAWTRKAQGRAPPASVSLEQAIPTLCHRWIAAMVEQGLVKYVVSQNIDGLHRRSGVPADKISELHGNCFIETCWGCGQERLSTTKVSQSAARQGRDQCAECKRRCPHFCHCTTTVCGCGRRMKDSIIHFGENLPAEALQRAYDHAARADLCIVLGSSLRVSPANEIPEIIARSGRLVVVNLQTTPLDRASAVRIYHETDAVAASLATRLGVTVPQDVQTPALSPMSSVASHPSTVAANVRPAVLPVANPPRRRRSSSRGRGQ